MMKINATFPELPKFEEYTEEIRSIFETGTLTNNGPKVQKLTSLLKERTGCDNLDVFVNGHLALVLGINSLDLPKGGEVLTSPFTFVSTTNAIIQCGLKPVFCDIDDTYNISIESIERNATKDTCAIITPHIFGIPCHVKEIQEIADSHKLKIIYDGAQAFGTQIEGIDIARFGDMTMFSLHAIKVFNSIEGGVLCYKDKRLKRKLVENRNFGLAIEDKENSEYIGINGKMDEFRASMGIVNISHVDKVIKKRKILADKYIECLKNIDGIKTFEYEDGVSYNYAYFPIRIDKHVFGKTRDEIKDILEKQGVGTRRLYGRLTCDMDSIKKHGYKCVVDKARKVSRECLDLPIYSSMSTDDVMYIAKIISKNQSHNL